MKKLMYLLPFAALAMASCSSSEDVAQNVQTPSQELKFFPAVEGTTRGAIETSSSISKFYVLPKGDFMDAAVEGAKASTDWMAMTKNGTSWDFPSAANKLWWASDDDNIDGKASGTEAQGTFTAFANALGSAGDMENATDGKLVNVIVPEALASQKDLVVAYNAGKRTDFLSGVPLHFRHALSQIIVNATYNKDATADVAKFPELDIKIKGVKFVNLADQGTLTLPTASTAAGKTYEPVWAGVSGTKEFAANPAAAVTLASAAKYIDDSEGGNPLLLMPQTTAATTNLNPTAPATVTGAYLMVQVDINYKDAFKPEGQSYKMIDLYPQPSTELDANQTTADTDSWAWIAVPVDIAWKGGYKYTYTLNFSNIACGKIAPNNKDKHYIDDAKDGDPVIMGVRTPVNFLVTVEENWTDGGSFTPAM